MKNRPPPPPPAPPEAPRAVPGKAWGVGSVSTIAYGGLTGIFGTSMTVGFIASGGPVWDDWILDARGVSANATVVRQESTGARARRQSVWSVDWRARDASGATVEGTVWSLGAWEGALVVQYDPESPSRSRIASQPAARHGALTPPAALIGLMGLGVMAAGIARVSRRKALYRNGATALGHVLSVAPTMMSVNGDRVHRVTLRYDTSSGSREVACTTPDEYAPGAAAWVIYDPSAPDRAMLA